MNATTDLTLPQRAAIALDAPAHEVSLRKLVEESKTITDIKTVDGRMQCHGALMTLKNARIAIEKACKMAREDATAFSKAIITEEKRLIDITVPEENRLQALRDKWDAEREAERQAKIETERQRVASIRKRIENIQSLPLQAIGKTEQHVYGMLEFLLNMEDDGSYDEFAPDFVKARKESLDALETILQEKKAAAAEAERQRQEAERIKAERAELEKLRAEVEARRLEDERNATAEREAEEAARRAAQEKQDTELEAQRAEFMRQIEEDEKRALLAVKKEEAQEAIQNETLEKTLLAAGVSAEEIANDSKPTLRLGQICDRLGFTVTADFLHRLGFEPAAREKAALLFHEQDFPRICVALIDHIRFISGLRYDLVNLDEEIPF